MKKPLNGKFILFYDEINFILKECFQLNEKIEILEDRISEIPKDRVYKLSDWETFAKVKKSLNYESVNEFPVELVFKWE